MVAAVAAAERGSGGSLQQQNHSLGMAVPGFGPASGAGAGAAQATATTGTGNAGTSADDLTKKIRKPYTITKSRESWTDQEHDKFLEALQLFDRDWKKIEAFVGSKTVIQIRSHAQKYFLKVQKNGLCDHVPPPRPKRKAAHPYPQKASKNSPPTSQTTVPYQAPSACVEPGYISTDPSSVLGSSTAGAVGTSWNQTSIPTVSASCAHKDGTGVAAINNCCSSTESSRRTWTVPETSDAANHVPTHRVMPDFSCVYGFIGGVFDPNTSGHLQKLREMDPIDVQTVLLLMRNLSLNLMNPDFKGHMRLLSSHDISSKETKSVITKDTFHSNEAINTPIRMKGE